MFISKEWKNEKVFTINNKTVSHKNVIKVTVFDLMTAHALINAPLEQEIKDFREFLFKSSQHPCSTFFSVMSGWVFLGIIRG